MAQRTATKTQVEDVVASMAQLPLTVLQSAYEAADSGVRQLLGDRLRTVVMGTGQADLLDAIAADVFDALPIVGEVSNALRVQDAAQRGEQWRKKALPPQLIDMAVGFLPPPVGQILSALTPTNTWIYLAKVGKER